MKKQIIVAAIYVVAIFLVLCSCSVQKRSSVRTDYKRLAAEAQLETDIKYKERFAELINILK